MKVLSSLKSAKQRHPDCQIVKRRGRVYVINKTNPRFKAVQGGNEKVRLTVCCRLESNVRMPNLSALACPSLDNILAKFTVYSGTKNCHNTLEIALKVGFDIFLYAVTTNTDGLTLFQKAI